MTPGHLRSVTFQGHPSYRGAMIPDIGLMVCAIGVVVCLYVMARAFEASQRAGVGGAAKGVLATAVVVSILAIPALLFLGFSVISHGTRTTEMR